MAKPSHGQNKTRNQSICILTRANFTDDSWYRPLHKANCRQTMEVLGQISSVAAKARMEKFTAWRFLSTFSLHCLARAVLPSRKLDQPPTCICAVEVKYLGDQDGKATKRFKVKVPRDVSADNLFCVPFTSLDSETISRILSKWKQLQTQGRPCEFVVVSADLGDGYTCKALIPVSHFESPVKTSVVEAIWRINQVSKHQGPGKETARANNRDEARSLVFQHDVRNEI